MDITPGVFLFSPARSKDIFKGRLPEPELPENSWFPIHQTLCQNSGSGKHFSGKRAYLLTRWSKAEARRLINMCNMFPISYVTSNGWDPVSYGRCQISAGKRGWHYQTDRTLCQVVYSSQKVESLMSPPSWRLGGIRYVRNGFASRDKVKWPASRV